MMIFKLKKPNLSKTSQQKILELLQHPQDAEMYNLIRGANHPKYLYWDKVKYKKTPKGMSSEEFWLTIKLFRRFQWEHSLISSEEEKGFSWIKLPKLEAFLHQLDLNTGGKLVGLQRDFEEKRKFQFISRGIMEEAIASSQLEGANTSRKIAKQFLREGRKPRNRSEHMILNNYQTMQAIEEEYKNHELKMDFLFELHRMITENTIPKNEQGRLRNDHEQIVVSDKLTGVVYHQPPKEKFLKKQLKTLLLFANDKLDSSFFLHPVLKAIMLHFWIGYLHPFTDGNGRLARILFYWYLLKNGYWAFSYLPISKMIRKSPKQYAMAYVYAEQDDYDLTYFIDYHIQKIELAIKDLEQYVQQQSLKNSQMKALSKSEYDLNERQIQLLQYLSKDLEAKTSLKVHTHINAISKVTALKDLKRLLTLGFVDAQKRGKFLYYFGTKKIEELFR